VLGVEARSRVPADFIPQLPEVVNPPALFLPFTKLAEAVSAAKALGREGTLLASAPHVPIGHWQDFLAKAWPKLSAWLNHMLASQAGSQKGSFRCVFAPAVQQHVHLLAQIRTNSKDAPLHG
jgi:hypothetical protein